MSGSGRRPSLHEKLKRSAPSPQRLHGASSGFKEQKRPKFILPKAAATPVKPEIQSPSTPASPTVFQRRPRYSIDNSASLQQSQSTPKTPKFSLKSRQPPEEEIDTYHSDRPPIHNPFDVSEELEEPATANPGRRTFGAHRFLTPSRSTQARSLSSAGRPATALLNSIKFDTSSKEPHHDVVLAADWSPHRRRIKGTGFEKDKFVPGGLAETVALWIYEDGYR